MKRRDHYGSGRDGTRAISHAEFKCSEGLPADYDPGQASRRAFKVLWVAAQMPRICSGPRDAAAAFR